MNEFYIQNKAATNYKMLISLTLIFIVILIFNEDIVAQDKNLIVRIARLQIDSAQLENYKAALKEQAETAVRVQPGGCIEFIRGL